MELKPIIFGFILLLSFSFFIYNVARLIKYLKIAKPENRFDNPFARIKNVLVVAFGQTKLLREKFAGILHFIIFWTFMLFLTAVLESMIQGFYPAFNWSFLMFGYSIITIVQEFFGLAVLIALILSFYRRFIAKVKRLQVGKKGQLDAAFILSMIFLIVLSMFGQNASHLAMNNFNSLEYEIRPFSEALSKVLYSNDASNANLLYEFFWYAHILLIFTFLNYLPYSKHLHILTSIPNVYFEKLGKSKFEIKPLNLEDESVESFGASDIDELTWKNLLDGYACTECGRCDSVCPANTTGKKLSPRKIFVDIRKRIMELAPQLINNKEYEDEKKLVKDYISEEELWACTTCSACMYECPVCNEHLDSIVEMRRYLILTESRFPEELNSLFKNLETNFSPWAFNSQDRANWAEGMNIKTLAEDNGGEILFWVGCAGSFDARYIKTTQAFAKILQAANVDFRILGIEEKCNGDVARRLGNEYLAQMLMQMNIETLNGYGVKKIVTACPHCFNTLKNEYPQFGGNYEVYHHSEYIKMLIEQGRLKLKNVIRDKKTITYHDSCYLSRYNELIDEPRFILKAANFDLKEMKRNKDRGFCCGAGGGRMFLEEKEGERVNVNRTKEALETNANIIASACPFCMTMLEDGLKTLDKLDKVQVKDITEIVLEKI